MTTVFFSLNGNSAASRTSFRPVDLNGVIFRKRPVINAERPPNRGVDPEKIRVRGKRFIGMLRLLKFILVLAVLIGAAIVGYAYLGDLSPEQSDVSAPVTLDGN